ncbi:MULTISPECIES: ROK family transcriptional regulator [Xanthomonas]|uniref:ROK family transcriptional regulator n=1 Tax=Xanthomonas rydalmerensis TaxID=3046274 RepID=A0ABZ0JQ31_9XANT|nr:MULTISPECIES: ROK family transcriptional regulator [unclassified Xanthomonas]MBB5875045.1 putative NBD/HSP70 family sugar kinase [Xanthomonas sp. 3498]WOS41916.1 ROK family transcriptional regulator [Xanthomonas sp. DM-2023]WOS46102.1 ROK family transcriptional regulator [Xanthomonas sp. DM-2023]WOS50280.1 ROK family transcriptional regulator [Xanthomonas sp. DM-2023]WOS54460.1 ROK family transcriptional regulator [Xanthomonas sp. DM-2023]
MIKKTLTPRARLVLGLVRRHGAVSRAALIRDTGLSGTAVFRSTDELEKAGLIRVGETIAEGRGQPSAMIHLQPDAAFSLGLSVMADRAEAVLVDLSGRIRARADVATLGLRRADVLARCHALAVEALGGRAAMAPRLIGVGVAIAGYFVDDGTVNPSPELEDWALVDFGPEIAQRFGVPVKIENVANAAAMGEYLLGTGATHASFCYLNFAMGFGGGIVIDGRLMRGRFGNAGELAGTLNAADLPVPHLAGLLHAVNLHDGHAFASLKDMLEAFDPQWQGVDAWLQAHTRSFQFLFSALRYTLDVDAIVLGGLLPAALAERVIAAVHWHEQTVAPRRLRPLPAPRLCVAQLPPETTAPVGAAALLFGDLLSA